MAFNSWERVAADERISGELKELLERGNPVDLMELSLYLLKEKCKILH